MSKKGELKTRNVIVENCKALNYKSNSRDNVNSLCTWSIVRWLNHLHMHRNLHFPKVETFSIPRDLRGQCWTYLCIRSRPVKMSPSVWSARNEIQQNTKYWWINRKSRVAKFGIKLNDWVSCTDVKTIIHSKLKKINGYYSFKIFPQFWLAKSTRITVTITSYWWPNLEEYCV